MIERNGVSRRAIFGSTIERQLSKDDLFSRVIDLVAPETTPQVQRLRDLQNQQGQISSQAAASAIGGVVSLFPVHYEFEQLYPGMNYVYGSQALPLGTIDIKLTHSHWFNLMQGIDEASVVFHPGHQTSEEVAIHLDGTEEDSGRSDIGAFDDFRPAIRMNMYEENAYIEELRAQGFYDYDIRIILEAVFQAVVYGERSTCWEDVVRPMLRIDALTAFNESWFREMLANRGIDPELFEVVSREVPIKESIRLIKRAERLGRFDAVRLVTRRSTKVVRDLFSPREKASVVGYPDSLNGGIVFTNEDDQAVE